MKNRLVLFLMIGIVCCGMAKPLQAQNQNAARKLLDKASIAFEAQNYDDCIQFLNASIQKDNKYIEAYITLFQVYLKIKQTQKGIEVFEKAFEIDSTELSPYYLKYATALATMGAYEKAWTVLNTYGKNAPNHQLQNIEDLKSICLFAKQYPRDKNTTVTNLGDSINTTAAEYFPTVTVQDSLLIFMRRDAFKREDFLYSKIIDSSYSKALPFADRINYAEKKGAPSLSSDLNTLYYAAEYNELGYGRYDIYKVSKTDSGWSSPINLGRNINSDFWESAPSISSDGQALYFSSNKPGGYGGIDIYVSYKNKNGVWGNAINLGPTINTKGDDQTPFIHADNRSLYFSSNGWPGYGGTDLFVSYKKVDGQWSTPINLGYPINTFDNEGSIAVASNGKEGYMASDRLDSRGGLDIYKVILAENTRAQKTYYFNGFIRDAITLTGLPGSVRLSNPNDNSKFMLVNVDSSGAFVLSIPEFDALGIQVNSPGHEYATSLINKDALLTMAGSSQYFNLNPIQNKFTKDFKNVFFELNAAELTRNSFVELDALVNYLTASANASIFIEGHTDNTGTESANLILSEKRARAIAQYLIDKGIQKERISTKGFGASKPIANNATPEGRAQNRRTSFTITLP